MSAFRDFRNQVSWGRICAAVALVVAVVGQFWKDMDSAHLVIWLGVALGNYGASKITEMVTTAKKVTVEAGPAGGDVGSSADPGTDQGGV